MIATDVGNAAATGGAGVPTTGAGRIGDSDVCGAVKAAEECRGDSSTTDDDGRLGSNRAIFQIVQIGRENVQDLIDQIRETVDEDDVVLFNDSSRQAEELG